jgi:hypothetical protein
MFSKLGSIFIVSHRKIIGTDMPRQAGGKARKDVILMLICRLDSFTLDSMKHYLFQQSSSFNGSKKATATPIFIRADVLRACCF